MFKRDILLRRGSIVLAFSSSLTSGSAPSGSEASNWSSRINRASGNRLATTLMEIHGKNSATRATKVATRGGGGQEGGHTAGCQPDVFSLQLAGAPSRPAW